MRTQFSPGAVVDRVDERDTFLQLLADESAPGILVLKTPEGSGKSYLMRYLHHLTREKGGAPILIEIEAARTRFWLIEKIAAQLADSSINLPNFDRLTKAQAFGDLEAFGIAAPVLPSTNTSLGIIGSPVSQGATVIGSQVSYHRGTAGLPPEAKEYAKKLRAIAFLDDLENACRENAIAILLDAYNDDGGDIHEWLVGPLLKQRVAGRKTYGGLVLVLAGEKVPIPAIQAALGGDFESMVDCRERLSQWNEDDVRKWLTQLGFRYDDPLVTGILSSAQEKGNIQALEDILAYVKSRLSR